MNVVMWLTIGVIVGRVASFVIGTREDIILDIIVGIIGAVMAGLVMILLLGSIPTNPNPFNFPAVLVSFGGAVILLAVLNLFRRRGYLLR